MVVKVSGFYCSGNCDSTVALKGCMGSKVFPKFKDIDFSDRHIAQCMCILDYIRVGKPCKFIVVCDYY